MFFSLGSCLIPLLFFIILFPLMFVGGIINTIFGRGRRNTHAGNRNIRKETWHSTAPQRKKRIENDEGEYIDFEEIKED